MLNDINEKRSFDGTQYDSTVVRSYYRFFSIGKMVIRQIYIIWKKILAAPLLSNTFHIFHFLYYNNTIYIFDNTLIPHIRPLNTTVRQLTNQSYRINLNRRILKYRSFSITYESFFNWPYRSYCVP
jgi:hypothetical protein